MRKVILVLASSGLCILTLAQVPQGFNYQAVAHTSTGAPIANTTIQVKAAILSDTITPVVVWEELHSTVKTNASGVFSLVIGTGTKQSGSASAFNEVDWTIPPLFIKIQVNYQGSWRSMGSAKLWTVPYAMVADDLTGSVKKLAVTGETSDMEEALFEVKNKEGQTVFAVYNEGVRIYVDDGAKGAKGGFAIGGFGSAKTPSRDLFVVNPDSVRVYIDTETGKGAKGGFAIGGFSSSKPIPEEYLRVTRDSTRVYLNDETKGTKGGFAIGGFGNSKSLPGGYMLIHPDSTRFYVRESGSGISSTFNIIGIKLDNTLTSLMTASTDTVGIGGVLNVQNNLTVTGDISYTGEVNSIVPEVVTIEYFNETDTSAMVTGEIISNGGKPVITSGIVWSTSPGPTIDLTTKTTDGTLTGQFTSTMSELTELTTYYVRAYAINENGTGYGNEITVTTVGVVFDIDGNWYIASIAGTQIWLLQNLKVTHLNDGTPIDNVTDQAIWMSLSTPGYAWYNNDAVTYADYGLLYNWATVNTGSLCPAGYHVPSEAELSTVIAWLGGPLVAGGSFKETGTTHWLDPNTGAENTDFGFAGLPGGLRDYMGFFSGIGENCNMWTSTRVASDPTYTSVYYNSAEIFVQTMMQGAGMSIRCLKD
ncbi:MAG: fibrobacter succinogenes major paralogous domain-containing protein [Bacteroidia bacterium]|nr:fibrobacter succinogenes major paralogous domain-containing protein [Bacteroidia bacterium]